MPGCCYINPVIDSNNPDPSVISLPTGGYLAVATSNLATDVATEPAFPIYFSPDLVAWDLQAEFSTPCRRGDFSSLLP